MKPKTSSYPKLVSKFPKEVKTIFKIFGDEILLVGGCVRDLLLRKKINDFDFATKILPQETIKILQDNKIKAVPTGLKFGTITAVINDKNFEITTLRKDFETDGRHCKPEFIDDYFFDAARRDFTINALYLDSKGVVIDYFDGVSDLKNKKVRFIGDAKKRVEEDFLRILRFFRFSCEYAKSLDKESLLACIKQKNNLKKLSKERIRAEILKMISTAEKENLIQILKVLESEEILQDVISSRLYIKDLEYLFRIEKELKINIDLNLKLAALFLKKKSDLEIFSKEILLTNSEKKLFYFLLQNQTKNISKLKLLLLYNSAEQVSNLYLYAVVKKFKKRKISLIKKNVSFLQQFVLPKFLVKSQDLIDLGYSGKNLGEALQKLKKLWVLSDFKLNKKDLIDLLKQGN